MVTRSYDPKRLDDPEYVKWLRSWNVDVDNLPEMKKATASRVVEPEDPAKKKSPEGSDPEKTPEKDENSSPPVPGSTSDTPVGGKRIDKDYEKWSLADLQAKAGELEISKSGNQAQLIKRIRDTEG